MAKKFINYIFLKEYVNDRLMKDLANIILDENNNHTIGTTFLHSNQFIGNIKLDNYFYYAKKLIVDTTSKANMLLEQQKQTSQLIQIQDIAALKNRMEQLVNQFFYKEEIGDNNNDGQDDGNVWNVNINNPIQIYDKRAVVIDMNGLDDDVNSQKICIFINNKPNAIDGKQIIKTIDDVTTVTTDYRNFTSYNDQNVEEYNLSYDNNQYVEIRDEDDNINYVENEFYQKWIIKKGTQIIAISDTLEYTPYDLIDETIENTEIAQQAKASYNTTPNVTSFIHYNSEENNNVEEPTE